MHITMTVVDLRYQQIIFCEAYLCPLERDKCDTADVFEFVFN